MNKIKKGDKIQICFNSIFEMMGYDKVTGTVFMVYPDGQGFGFKCDQTHAIEGCNFGDGDILVL